MIVISPPCSSGEFSVRASFVLVVMLAVAGCAAQAITPPAPHAAPPTRDAPAKATPAPATRHRAALPYRRDRLPRVRVPQLASGHYAVVTGQDPARRGRGSVVRYLVEVERGLPFDRRDFAARVHATLNDPRGWARFHRVDHGQVRLRVALSSPGLTDRQCLPLNTGGDLSCWNGTRSVINAVRWVKGVPQYRGDLEAYRDYVISHEVGHGLGHGHAFCPGPGRLAPVMAQQSKTLGGCRPNPWPYP